MVLTKNNALLDLLEFPISTVITAWMITVKSRYCMPARLKIWMLVIWSMCSPARQTSALEPTILALKEDTQKHRPLFPFSSYLHVYCHRGKGVSVGDTGELSDPYFLVSKVLSKSDSIFIQKSNRIAVFLHYLQLLKSKG